MRKAVLITTFSVGILFTACPQPLAFNQNVKIHEITLNEYIDNNHFSNDTINNFAYKYFVSTVCNYVLSEYEKTGSYTASLELLRGLLKSSFVTKDTSVIDTINARIGSAIIRRYEEDKYILNKNK